MTIFSLTTPTRTAYASIALLILLAPTVSAEDKKMPKAEQILDNYIEAVGGEEKLKAIHNRVYKGKMEIGGQGMPQAMEGTIEIYEAKPDKRYSATTLGPMGKVENGTNGEVHWQVSMMGPQVLEGPDRALSERRSQFYSTLNWKSIYEKAETIGEAEVDGKPCYKVKMVPKEGPEEIVYYSKKTHLQTKTELSVNGGLGEMKVETLLMDWREVDGVKLPHKIVQRNLTTKQSVTITFNSIDCNVDMPADRFELPEAIKAIVAQSKNKEAANGKQEG